MFLQTSTWKATSCAASLQHFEYEALAGEGSLRAHILDVHFCAGKLARAARRDGGARKNRLPMEGIGG